MAHAVGTIAVDYGSVRRRPLCGLPFVVRLRFDTGLRRQFDQKLRLAVLGFDGDRSAVRLDERSRDVEAESQPSARRSSSKRLEHVLSLLGGNRAAIRHRSPYLVIAAPGSYRDRRIGVAMLDGIVE